MSGGSYEYYYNQDLEDQIKRRQTLLDMAKSLRENHNRPQLAERLERIHRFISFSLNLLDNMMQKQTSLMKAIEWVDSADSGEDALDEFEE